ncbi:MAG: glycosyltransferase family 4 protein [Bacteroidetes bacterium]|nr:glycosyltransferase family 4 protein [Bacteroidota bacterium]
MNILMLLETDFPPDARVENEATSLAEAGHTVHIACWTRKGRKVEDRFGDVYIHRKPISPLRYKSAIGALTVPYYFNFWKDHAGKIMQSFPIDAIHIHDLPLALVGIEIKRKHHIPLVIDLHENYPALLDLSTHTKKTLGKLFFSRRRWEQYEAKVLKEADQLIVVVDEARERLISMGIPAEKIQVVSNTINLSGLDFPETYIPNIEKVLFYAGGINEHRGLQVVVKAIGMLKQKGLRVHFQVIGEGSYRQNLEALAAALGVTDLIHFTGYKPFREMLEILKTADAAIIPHVKSDHTDATIPHKLFQYMYAGKPVIASNCAPIERIIRETGTGYIYRHDDPADLGNILENALLGQTNMDEIRIRGRKAVTEKYHWGVDGNILLNMYRGFAG